MQHGNPNAVVQYVTRIHVIHGIIVVTESSRGSEVFPQSGTFRQSD